MQGGGYRQMRRERCCLRRQVFPSKGQKNLAGESLFPFTFHVTTSFSSQSPHKRQNIARIINMCIKQNIYIIWDFKKIIYFYYKKYFLHELLKFKKCE